MAAAAVGEDVPMDEADVPNAYTDSFQAWHKRTLAAFTAFLRSHSVVIAPLAPQIQDLLGTNVSDDVQKVVSRHLCM